MKNLQNKSSEGCLQCLVILLNKRLIIIFAKKRREIHFIAKQNSNSNHRTALKSMKFYANEVKTTI